MPEISVNVEVFCASCGQGLCGMTSVKNHRGGDALEVEACDKCIESARDEGYEAGYAQAEKDKEPNQ